MIYDWMCVHVCVCRLEVRSCVRKIWSVSQRVRPSRGCSGLPGAACRAGRASGPTGPCRVIGRRCRGDGLGGGRPWAWPIHRGAHQEAASSHYTAACLNRGPDKDTWCLFPAFTLHQGGKKKHTRLRARITFTFQQELYPYIIVSAAVYTVYVGNAWVCSDGNIL